MNEEADPVGEDSVRQANEALKAALQRLAEVLGQQVREDQAAWLRDLQAASRVVFDTLENHEHRAESEEGVLSQVTERKPQLMAERIRLEREHADMLHRAELIEVDIGRQLEFDEFELEITRLEASILHDMLQLHLLRTDSLMYEAFFRVEGGEQG